MLSLWKMKVGRLVACRSWRIAGFTEDGDPLIWSVVHSICLIVDKCSTGRDLQGSLVTGDIVVTTNAAVNPALIQIQLYKSSTYTIPQSCMFMRHSSMAGLVSLLESCFTFGIFWQSNLNLNLAHRSVGMDAWSPDQLKKMQLGGNDKLNEFLDKYGVPKHTDIKEKYNSKAAEVWIATVPIHPAIIELLSQSEISASLAAIESLLVAVPYPDFYTQIYRDKLRADVEGKPFVVPPPSDITSSNKKPPSRSSSRQSLSSNTKTEEWGDWGEPAAPQRPMRVWSFSWNNTVCSFVFRKAICTSKACILSTFWEMGLSIGRIMGFIAKIREAHKPHCSTGPIAIEPGLYSSDSKASRLAIYSQACLCSQFHGGLVDSCHWLSELLYCSMIALLHNDFGATGVQKSNCT